MTELTDRPFRVVTDAPTSGLQAAAQRVDHLAESFRDEFRAMTADVDLSVPVVDHPKVGSWLSRHDERSREYAYRKLVTASVPVQDHTLPLGPLLLQGPEGACPGFAAAHASNIIERLHGGTELLDAAAAHQLYERAKVLDQWPGEDYVGSSVLAAMQAGQERELWEGYTWSFGTRDIAQAILANRPVVVGVPWLSGMFDTGPDAIVNVTGSNTGQGHALCLFATRTEVAGRPGPWFGWQNSQSADYGDDGVGWVHHRDLARLLAGVGEAAVPLVAG